MTRLFATIEGQEPAALVELKATPEGHLITSSTGQSSPGAAGSPSASSALKFSKSATVGDTTYVLKTSATDWLVVKLVALAGTEEATYASKANNGSHTSVTAWTERTSLVYAQN